MDAPFSRPLSIASAPNAPVSITFPAQPGKRIGISDLTPGYSTAGAVGLITVTIGGILRFQWTVIGAFASQDFAPPIAGEVGDSVTVTLAAGGVGITGFLNLAYVVLDE